MTETLNTGDIMNLSDIPMRLSIEDIEKLKRSGFFLTKEVENVKDNNGDGNKRGTSGKTIRDTEKFSNYKDTKYI